MGIDEDEKSRRRKKLVEKILPGVFICGVGGFTLMTAFSRGMKSATKRAMSDPKFAKDMKPGHRHEDSSALAAKALAWGTFWAVTGIGAMTFTIFKILGISNISEIPKIPKSKTEGRNEFASIRELVDYLIDEDEKKKALKESTAKMDS